MITPREFARLDIVERGRVCAPLTLVELDAFAHEYADYLEKSTRHEVTVTPRDVFNQLMVTTLVWRDTFSKGAAR